MSNEKIVGLCGLSLASFGACVAALIVVAPFAIGIPTTDMPAAKTSDIPSELCKVIEVPASDEEFYTIWRAPRAATLTGIFCEVSTETSVAFDFEVDDGTPAGVNGSDITCTTSGVEDTSLGGDTAMAAGDRLDIDLAAVTGDVDLFSACLRYTLD